jgi:hypothetical protein
MSLPLHSRSFSVSRIVFVSVLGVMLLMARASAPNLRKTSSALTSVLHCHSSQAKRAWLGLDSGFDPNLAPGKIQILPPFASARVPALASAPRAAYQPSRSYQNRPPPLV